MTHGSAARQEAATVRSGQTGECRRLRAGFTPVTVASVADDHKRYYPGAHQISLRVTGDRDSGPLIGMQLVGKKNGSVAKRVDIAATALFARLTVHQLSDLDLAYTLPLGSPWDAVRVVCTVPG